MCIRDRRTPRPVTLHSIMLAGSPAPNEYILNIHCSKGTYVRVLLEDICLLYTSRCV